MKSVKVVELNTTAERKVSLPPILQSIRHASRRQLAGLMQSLFDNTDDALFELADRSGSDQQQEMYFDSMRHVRLHRKQIAERFLRAYKASYEDLVQNVMSEDTHDFTTDNDQADEFSLIENDDLEITVAVAGMVSKVTSQHSLAVMQLTRRFDALLTHVEVTERLVPLGPHALATLFADALAGLDVHIKVRIIILKLFERFVMQRLGTVFDEANRMLVDAGVLPDLKQRRSVRQTTPTAPPASSLGEPGRDDILPPAAAEAPAYSSAGPASGVSFAAIQSLLAEQRGPRIQVADVAPSFRTEEVFEALTNLQTSAREQPTDLGSAPQTVDVNALLTGIAATKNRSISQVDDDAVNFIGMLFDYILNDRNLAIPMKALIGRLQIPMIKLALVDKTFFERSMHPARSLLNELSSAGIGWSSAQELKRDAMYDKIEAVVHKILSEFTDDPQLFEDQLQAFRAFVTKENRRSVLVEQRVKDTELGKSRSFQAKSKAQQVINHKACGLRLPQPVGHFISDTWSKVLVMRMLKFGEASSEWQDGVSVLDDLLWLVQPLSELADIDKRDRLLPKVCEQIANGVAEIGGSPETGEDFTQWLTDKAVSLSASDRAFLTQEIDTPADEAQQGSVEPIMEEIVLAEVQEQAAIAPELQSHIQQMSEGTWVEIQLEDDEKTRCKLSTVTEPQGNYVFVNRRGMKITEKNRAELAELFKAEKISLIDESQVFDRALRSVISNLRTLHRES